MREREIKILQLLIGDDYINTPIICQQMKISTRSARYSINLIKDFLRSEDCELKYSNKKGYYFNKRQNLKVKILISELLNSNVIISNASQRYFYLLGQLLFHNSIVYTKVCNELFIDRAIIKKDIKQLETRLNQKLLISPEAAANKWNYVDKLQIVTNLVMNESQVYQEINAPNIRILFNSVYTEQRTQLVNELCHQLTVNQGNKYVDFQVYWLVYFVVANWGIEELEQASTNYQQLLKAKLTKSEYDVCREYLLAIGIDAPLQFEQDLVELVVEFMKKIASDYRINLDIENYLFDQLLRQIHQIKLQNELQIRYKFTACNRMIRLYPYSFSIAQQLLNFIGLGHLNRHQVAYVCETIQKILFESNHSKSILIIHRNDEIIVNHYRDWIKYQYTKNIQVLDCSPSQAEELAKQNGQNLLLIINFTPNIMKDVQCLQLTNKLSTENIKQITHHLQYENETQKFMNKFIKQSLLKVYTYELDFPTILRNVSEQLEKKLFIQDGEQFFNSCQQREQIGTTFVGYETMIVHPIKANGIHNCLHVSVCPKIEVNGDQVSLIIVCSFKENINFEVSRLFEIIMKLIENDEYRNLLIKSPSEMDLLINLNNILTKI